MHTPTIRLPQARLLAGIGAGILVGVIGVGVVTAAPGAPAGTAATGQLTASTIASGPTGTAGTTGARPKAIRRGGLRGLIRNNFRVTIDATNRHGERNILYVRGSLTIGSGTVTVTLPDNSTQVFTTSSSTVVRERGHKIALSNLQSGERAMVFGTKNSDGTWTAKVIRSFKEARTTAPTAPGATTAPTT
ncbi:MAG TPA: DUF5666 domain-containing protein, partial [Candidatus Saccharimonadales bacterium]|nr:DUF5666 domain-containing protein [Candidatus Saccharimonadales bacterium]